MARPVLQPPMRPLPSETPDDDSAALAAALRDEGIELSLEQFGLVDGYRRLLWEWNDRLNLTRHTTVEKFVTRDVVDSIEFAKLLGEDETVLDVGSGGGVPGLLLAILRPDLVVSVCDSVAKKSKVLEEIAAELGLPVTVHAARVQDVLEGEAFHSLVARGVAPLWKLCTWLDPHRQAFGRLLVVKGPAWVEERGEARHRGTLKGFDLRREAEYTTPRTTAVSTILSVAPKAAPEETALREEPKSAKPTAKKPPARKSVGGGAKGSPKGATAAKKKRYPRPWDRPSGGRRDA